jgi:hypothetical protein
MREGEGGGDARDYFTASGGQGRFPSFEGAARALGSTKNISENNSATIM